MNNPIRIALVDDHRLFRSAIAALIHDFDGYTVIFEAGDGREMIRKLNPELKPHIILLDIQMPGMSGIRTAGWLRDNHPGIAIIVLSMFDDPEKILAMVSIGVKGYLLKDADPGEFEAALRSVSANGLYYPEFVTRCLGGRLNGTADFIQLNSRELAFLQLAATEYTYKEIAGQLCISTRTVDGY